MYWYCTVQSRSHAEQYGLTRNLDYKHMYLLYQIAAFKFFAMCELRELTASFRLSTFIFQSTIDDANATRHLDTA